MTEQRTERLSHARITVDAHGVNADAQAVFDPSFVTAEARLPLPYVDGDKYLSGAGLVVSERGGTTITLETPPGYVDHMREIGVLPDDTIVVQRPITINRPEIQGYPAASPLGLLAREGYRFSENGNGPYYVGIFESDDIRREAQETGMQLLGRPDSVITNNKARLHEFGPDYGINLPPGAIIRSWEDLNRYAVEHEGEIAWYKASTESGGDGVHKIDGVSRQALYDATQKMRNNAVTAFSQGEFPVTAEEYWPEGAVSPSDFPNIIEEHAGLLGDIVVNGSNCFVTKANGEIDYYGTFQQITSPDGEFMGSRLYHPDAEVEAMIMDQTERMARFSMEVNGYSGIQGMDFFVIRDANGNLQVYPFELNARPPISSYPAFLMENLRTELAGYDSKEGTWDNVNLVSQTPIVRGTKIPDLIGKDLAFGVRDKSGRVLRQVIPLATRALVMQNGHGEADVIPSEKAKWFVYGSDVEQKELALQELATRGVVFKG